MVAACCVTVRGHRCENCLKQSRLQGIHVRKLVMQPYPLTPAFFAERIRGVSLEVSMRLHARWRALGLLDAHGFSNVTNTTALACAPRPQAAAAARALLHCRRHLQPGGVSSYALRMQEDAGATLLKHPPQ